MAKQTRAIKTTKKAVRKTTTKKKGTTKRPASQLKPGSLVKVIHDNDPEHIDDLGFVISVDKQKIQVNVGHNNTAVKRTYLVPQLQKLIVEKGPAPARRAVSPARSPGAPRPMALGSSSPQLKIGDHVRVTPSDLTGNLLSINGEKVVVSIKTPVGPCVPIGDLRLGQLKKLDGQGPCRT